MTDLSPSAQAVLDAYGSSPLLNDHVLDHRHCLAAAIRAATQFLAYECYGEGWFELVVDARDLYDLADDLEKTND